MVKPRFFREVGFFFLNYLLYNPGGIMGKTRRRLRSPKFARKYANVRAAIARRKGEVEPEPAPIVEEVTVVTEPVVAVEKAVTIAVPEPAETPIAVGPEVVSVVEPEPVVVESKPAPKVAKKATTKRRTTKRTATKRTTTKRTKRTTTKKDK
tara:strand:- start:1288 stop:1743 length:456 start_codon:yes stop_codon:yes gene_type:complete